MSSLHTESANIVTLHQYIRQKIIQYILIYGGVKFTTTNNQITIMEPNGIIVELIDIGGCTNDET